MTTFFRLLADKEKAHNLLASCTALRSGEPDARVFQVAPESFRAVPGAPFAYWVSEAVRFVFTNLSPFEEANRSARVGLQTSDDFRFVRASWETNNNRDRWWGFAKGGAFSPYYSNVHLVANWADNGTVMKAWADPLYGNSGWSRILKSTDYYTRPGLTWPSRTNGLSFRVMPQGCIFTHKGPAAFVSDDAPESLLALCALVNSQAFGLLVSVRLARAELAQSFEVGLIQQTPVPDINPEKQAQLAALARRAWSLKRTLDTIEETSHAFALPAALRARLGDYNPPAIEAELARIQTEIDAIAFDLYGFSEADRAGVQASQGTASESDAEASADDDSDDEESAAPIDQTAGLLSWAVGVAFGRFDWRLATGEREAPPEPDPFDPLPAKSPGMLPDGAAPFHVHAGILVDDPGYPHDLPHLVESVLDRVEIQVATDVRRWLQREFFPEHLKRYSKSRRKAPIYWPLSTLSGNYTLWVYYPALTSQTLYTAVNDFVEPKLKSVSQSAQALRAKGNRSRVEEKDLERLQDIELELKEFRENLLRIAQGYVPNYDDGVQITAAPLWPLFQHTPWQKVLKDTWKKLEKGDYDWAHLAYAYRPDQVREKCRTDKSLAIAHGLEALYEEKPVAPKKARTRNT